MSKTIKKKKKNKGGGSGSAKVFSTSGYYFLSKREAKKASGEGRSPLLEIEESLGGKDTAVGQPRTFCVKEKN